MSTWFIIKKARPYVKSYRLHVPHWSSVCHWRLWGTVCKHVLWLPIIHYYYSRDELGRRPLHTFFNFSKFIFLLVIISDGKASVTFLKDLKFIMKVTYSLWQLNWQGSFFNEEPFIYRQYGLCCQHHLPEAAYSRLYLHKGHWKENSEIIFRMVIYNPSPVGHCKDILSLPSHTLILGNRTLSYHDKINLLQGH